MARAEALWTCGVLTGRKWSRPHSLRSIYGVLCTGSLADLTTEGGEDAMRPALSPHIVKRYASFGQNSCARNPDWSMLVLLK